MPTYVVANNRGGVGKSTVAAQLAMHRAASSPRVALLDCTVAADVSCHLLGGTREPLEPFDRAVTEGQRNLFQLPEKQRMSTLIGDLKKHPTGIGAVLSNFGLGGGVGPDLKDRLYETASGVHLLAGGPELKDAFKTPEECQAVAARIRSLVAALPGGEWEVILDIDAEFRERLHSLLGLLVADRAIVVLSDRWADYVRFATIQADPYNSLFPCLKAFAASRIPIARVHKVVFNGSRAVKYEPSGYLSFTPAAIIKKEVNEITMHLFEKAFEDPENIYAESVETVEAFRARFVASLPRLPDAAMADSLQFGTFVGQSASATYAEASVDALARRVFG